MKSKVHPLTRWIGAISAWIWLGFFPSVLQACPRCVDATPFKIGMQWAVVVLLPVPPVLATLLILWIKRESKSEIPPS